MPMAISPKRGSSGITRLTGGKLVKGDRLVEEDLWISSATGKILPSQEVFYSDWAVPDRVIDLNGKILAAGFIDVQFNGAFGFDFSTIPEDMNVYDKGLKKLNRLLVRTGVTSYLPTLPSQSAEVYHKALPYLGRSGTARKALQGSESLGAHCEGPFISPTKNGIHSLDVLREAKDGFASLKACYGAKNMESAKDGLPPTISMITAAPEVTGIAAAIPECAARGIRFAIGHTEATYEQAGSAIKAGASMITHLFNAMRPLHHRNPGPFGVLGSTGDDTRPYFGIISDGIHLHPTTVKLAFNAHPDGFILVTDAMKTVGLPDGIYDWTNGDRWIKKGGLLTREGSDTIAGSSATLIECVNNFLNWSDSSIPQAISAVTRTPAKMLGLADVKGSLEPNADADLVILDVKQTPNSKRLEIEQVWKFGVLVYSADDEIRSL